MSADQIKLLESIRDGIEHLGDRLGGQIGETNAKLDSVDQRLVNVERQLDQHLGRIEVQIVEHFEKTNQRVDSIRTILSEGFGSLSTRADKSDERITRLEHRVDKLEQTG